MKKLNSACLTLALAILLASLAPPASTSAASRVRDDTVAPSSSGLAPSPWPMHKHDIRRTSLSSFNGPDRPYVKWQFSITSAQSNPAIGADGTIYLGSDVNRFYAVNPNGSPKWSYSTPNYIWSSPAVADDGTIYTSYNGYSTGNFLALDANGLLKGSYPAREVRSSPAIMPDGTIYVGAVDYRLYAFYPDVPLKWRYAPGFTETYGSPAIGPDGTIYIGGSTARNLHAVNPDGTVKWIFETPNAVQNATPMVDGNGTIYISGGNVFYAINPDSSLKWSLPPLPGEMLLGDSSLGPDGTIYTMSTAGRLYAFSPGGTLKWTYSNGGLVVVSAMTTVDAKGTIYFTTFGGKIFAINPNGTEKWVFQTPSPDLYSTAVINSEGGLYVSGVGGLYSIGNLPTDTTPPVITGNLTGTPGNNGWYKGNVTVTWNVDDPDSGIASSVGCHTTTLATDTFGTTLTCSATNGAGLSASRSVTIKIDKTPPIVTVRTPGNGQTYPINAAVASDYSCMDTISGLISCSGPVATGANFATGTAGAKSFVVTASDNAGNTASVTSVYTVLYFFAGFYPPVDNLPSINIAKSGQTIPIKWSLKDAYGNLLSDLATAVSYGYGSVACSSGTTDVIDQYADAGSTSLRYDVTAGQFILNSKTDPSWAGSCKTFTLVLSDGTKHQASFQFR